MSESGMETSCRWRNADRRRQWTVRETGDGSVSPVSLGKRRHRTVPCLLGVNAAPGMSGREEILSKIYI